MRFDDYLNSLTTSQLERYAKRAKTSVRYLTNLKKRMRRPSPEKVKLLVAASDGCVSRFELVSYFWMED